MSKQTTNTAIFWRRRLLVLAAVIALVWVIVQGVEKFTSDSAPKPASNPVPPKPTATAISDGPVQVRLTKPAGNCDPEKVRVTPSVPTGQKNRGPVKVVMVMSTSAKKSCTLQPKNAELVTIISADGQPTWDSTVCKTSMLDRPVNIAARWSTQVTTEWTGRVSGSSCSGGEDWARAGDYTIEVGTLGGEPGEATFQLAPAPEPAPSPKPKPKSSTATPKPAG